MRSECTVDFLHLHKDGLKEPIGREITLRIKVLKMIQTIVDSLNEMLGRLDVLMPSSSFSSKRYTFIRSEVVGPPDVECEKAVRSFAHSHFKRKLTTCGVFCLPREQAALKWLFQTIIALELFLHLSRILSQDVPPRDEINHRDDLINVCRTSGIEIIVPKIIFPVVITKTHGIFPNGLK